MSKYREHTVTLRLANTSRPDFTKVIDCLQRAIDGKPQCNDVVNLIGARGIIESIMDQIAPAKSTFLK